MAETTTQVIEWTLGERLAKARRLKGWNQTELAQNLGIGRRSISRYEDDIAVPSRAVLIAWAEVTGVPFGWLQGPSLMGTHIGRYRTVRRHRNAFAQVMGAWHPARHLVPA